MTRVARSDLDILRLALIPTVFRSVYTLRDWDSHPDATIRVMPASSCCHLFERRIASPPQLRVTFPRSLSICRKRVPNRA
jgi:hypothetical protein